MNAHVTHISHNALPSPTSPVAQRDERSSWRCANKVGPEPTHKKRTRRGYRSEAPLLQKKAEHKEKRRRARAQYRHVRQRWKISAKTPAKLTLAQERILADTLLEDMQTKQRHWHQSDDSLKTTEKALKIATFNVKGLDFASGQQQLMYLMTKHHIDIVALQETHVNYTGKEHGDFPFYFPVLLRTITERKPTCN